MMATHSTGEVMAGNHINGKTRCETLLRDLEHDLDSARMTLKEIENMLGELKVLGRSLDTARPIFSRKGVTILSRYGLDHTAAKSAPTSREALRCLANALLLNEACRQLFVDIGYAHKLAVKLKIDDRNDEFLASRILFLLTYNTTLGFGTLVNECDLASNINTQVARHSKAFSSKSARRKSDANPMQDMAMVETLKLMFNITHYYPDLAAKFTPSIEPLVDLIVNHPLPTPPLSSPINYMLNALLNLDLAGVEKKSSIGPEAKFSPLFPYSSPERVVERLTTIFNKAIVTMPEKELDQAAFPLCTLLRRLYELASLQMREWMQMVMLPRDSDRNRPLGIGDTMAARLLRLSCSPNLPTLRENISSLLFEMSDKDADKFVKNIGYGFASGFLMSHNIQIPSSATEASSIPGDGENNAQVNPVTGQNLSAEAMDRSDNEEMSQEEKEREAERLFVLFERLKATGVIDVKNPVQQAVEDGRFEEIE